MGRARFVEVFCDDCGFRAHDRTMKMLIPRLRKAEWQIRRNKYDKDLCNLCREKKCSKDSNTPTPKNDKNKSQQD